MATSPGPAKRSATEAQLDAAAAAAPAAAAARAEKPTSAAKPEVVALPQKKFFRQRAHCNPLSFSDTFAYPPDPDHFDHPSHFPLLAVTVRALTQSWTAHFRRLFDVFSTWCFNVCAGILPIPMVSLSLFIFWWHV